MLLEQYANTNRRSIKNKIYQIIQDRDSPDKIVKELSLSEFLETGDEPVLDGLKEHMTTDEIVHWLVQKKVDVNDKERRRSEEHTSELQSRGHLVCRLLLEKKKRKRYDVTEQNRIRR